MKRNLAILLATLLLLAGVGLMRFPWPTLGPFRSFQERLSRCERQVGAAREAFVAVAEGERSTEPVAGTPRHRTEYRRITLAVVRVPGDDVRASRETYFREFPGAACESADAPATWRSPRVPRTPAGHFLLPTARLAVDPAGQVFLGVFDRQRLELLRFDAAADRFVPLDEAALTPAERQFLAAELFVPDPHDVFWTHAVAARGP